VVGDSFEDAFEEISGVEFEVEGAGEVFLDLSET